MRAARLTTEERTHQVWRCAITGNEVEPIILSADRIKCPDCCLTIPLNYSNWTAS